MEKPKIILFEFICKINADAKFSDINSWMIEDTCDYMAHILDYFGYTLDKDFYNQEYPEWYIALEALVVNIAMVNNIFK